MGKTGYLVLENGAVFQGQSFGALRDVTGELVFTTGMTGYLETLTDPSYYGQMVVQTFPLIGNYGVIPVDFESSSPALQAYIVKDYCQEPSNFRSQGALDIFLSQNNVPGLWGVDTRALTRIVREYGVMNAALVQGALPQDLTALLAKIKSYRITGAVEAVTCQKRTVLKSQAGRYRVGLWHFGAKKSIQDQLLARGCDVTLLPAAATAEEILAQRFDGLMLSNGPGDPQDNPGIIAELQKVMVSGLPIFGICLGHQLLALAHGAKTEKLKYGHRGANQPVVSKEGRVYITSQNHGYCVVSETLPASAQEIFHNGNDHTCEGVRYLDKPVFSVQFHPEASGGPLDTRFLFDQFIAMLEGGERQ